MSWVILIYCCHLCFSGTDPELITGPQAAGLVSGKAQRALTDPLPAVEQQDTKTSVSSPCAAPTRCCGFGQREAGQRFAGCRLPRVSEDAGPPSQAPPSVSPRVPGSSAGWGTPCWSHLPSEMWRYDSGISVVQNFLCSVTGKRRRKRSPQS